jgi:hypothetical protein
VLWFGGCWLDAGLLFVGGACASVASWCDARVPTALSMQASATATPVVRIAVPQRSTRVYIPLPLPCCSVEYSCTVSYVVLLYLCSATATAVVLTGVCLCTPSLPGTAAILAVRQQQTRISEAQVFEALENIQKDKVRRYRTCANAVPQQSCSCRQVAMRVPGRAAMPSHAINSEATSPTLA